MVALVSFFSLFLFAEQSVALQLRANSNRDLSVAAPNVKNATDRIVVDKKDDSTEYPDNSTKDVDDSTEDADDSIKDASNMNLRLSTNDKGMSEVRQQATSMSRYSSNLGVTLKVDNHSLRSGEILAVVKSDSSASLNDVTLLVSGQHTAYHMTADNKCNHGEKWDVKPYPDASGDRHRVVIPAGTSQVGLCISDGDGSGVDVSLLNDESTSMIISLPQSHFNVVV
eukprot:GEMP01082354.1.p1 GENE.GEMP01082354.1~~GEMP01082354.1.p1  ORF type:complete len:226 (+),score=38.78 GEMP01082354.1:171-848(+)